MQGHDTDRTHIFNADWRVVCLQCEQPFEAKRSDATFCSARCRVSYSREPQRIANAIQHMTMLTNQLDNYAKKYPRNKQMFEAMRILRNSIDMSLGRFEYD